MIIYTGMLLHKGKSKKEEKQRKFRFYGAIHKNIGNSVQKIVSDPLDFYFAYFYDYLTFLTVFQRFMILSSFLLNINKIITIIIHL